MTRYLISFDDGAMTFPGEDMPDVAKAGHEVTAGAFAHEFGRPILRCETAGVIDHQALCNGVHA